MKPNARRKAIIADLYASGETTLAQACKVAGIGRTTEHEWRKADHAYNAAIERARESRVQILEDEAYRRACAGCEKPVYQGGKQCGTITEYSDTLLIFLLKSANPAKYRDRWTQPIDDADSPAKILERIAKEHGDDDSDSN